MHRGGDNGAVADAPGDDQPDGIAGTLLVGKGIVVNVLDAFARGDGKAELLQNCQNPGGIRAAAGSADNGHADGHGLSVGQGEVASGFHPVADGVPQVQLHPGAGVEFVLHDHIPLQLYASGDDRFPVKIQAFFFQMGK